MSRWTNYQRDGELTYCQQFRGQQRFNKKGCVQCTFEGLCSEYFTSSNSVCSRPRNKALRRCHATVAFTSLKSKWSCYSLTERFGKLPTEHVASLMRNPQWNFDDLCFDLLYFRAHVALTYANLKTTSRPYQSHHHGMPSISHQRLPDVRPVSLCLFRQDDVSILATNRALLHCHAWGFIILPRSLCSRFYIHRLI